MDISSNRISLINIDIDVVPIPTQSRIFDNIMLDTFFPSNHINHNHSLNVNPTFFYNEIDDDDDFYNENTNTIFNIPSLTQMNRIIEPYRTSLHHVDATLNTHADTSHNNIIEQIINHSFTNDKSIYKLSLSDEGKKQLEYLNYTTSCDENYNNTECPILLVDFEEGQDIIRLPCKHYFSKNAIETWLNDKPECPVCRFKLYSIEVKNDLTIPTNQEQTSRDLNSVIQMALLNGFEYDDIIENNISHIDPDTEFLIATLINYFDSLDTSSTSFTTDSNVPYSAHD